jgi:hypothetical protein
MSDSYAGHARARPRGPRFAIVPVLSVAAAIAVILAGAVYYAGSSARIASDYTALADLANQALTTEVDGYTHNQRDDLAAARGP